MTDATQPSPQPAEDLECDHVPMEPDHPSSICEECGAEIENVLFADGTSRWLVMDEVHPDYDEYRAGWP